MVDALGQTHLKLTFKIFNNQVFTNMLSKIFMYLLDNQFYIPL